MLPMVVDPLSSDAAKRTATRPATIAWRVVKRSLSLASVRYRAVLPALALAPFGHRSTIIDSAADQAALQADLLVISKSFASENIALARQRHEAGKAVVLDLCDNVFIPEYGNHRRIRPSDVFIEMARYANAVCCPTTALADVLRDKIDPQVPVIVIPDSIDSADLADQQQALLNAAASAPRSATSRIGHWMRRLFAELHTNRRQVKTEPPPASRVNTIDADIRRVLWFGNHGSAHGDFGLTDILSFAPALQAVATEVPLELVVVSNNAERYNELIRPLPLRTQYREWSVDVLDDALSEADVTIIPNSRDAFSICKSANRSILSLQHGVPVVATAVPALDPLSRSVWTDDPAAGLSTYLTNPTEVNRALAQAKRDIEQHFSLAAVGKKWHEVVSSAVKQ